MKSLFSGSNALAIFIMASLSACGQTTISSPRGAATQNNRPGFSQASPRGRSWISPGSSTEDLLYVSSARDGNVFVYSYPSGALVGTLTNLNAYAAGECVDSAGDIFITTSDQNEVGTVYEYAHGGTQPIAVLADPGLANGCAIDPKSGDLAVSNIRDSSNPYYPGDGDVAVYGAAQGNPTMYYSPDFTAFFFCGYDDAGNLYLSASGQGSDEANLVRLANGGSSLDLINVDEKIQLGHLFDPSVQWDGKHLTISTSQDPVHGDVSIYQLNISGSSATVVGTTTLSSRRQHHAGESWLEGGTAIGINGKGYRSASFWNYPKGGKPYQSIRKIGGSGTQYLWGVTVSPKQSQ